jgi:hypothetical protein
MTIRESVFASKSEEEKEKINQELKQLKASHSPTEEEKQAFTKRQKKIELNEDLKILRDFALDPFTTRKNQLKFEESYMQAKKELERLENDSTFRETLEAQQTVNLPEPTPDQKKQLSKLSTEISDLAEDLKIYREGVRSETTEEKTLMRDAEETLTNLTKLRMQVETAVFGPEHTKDLNTFRIETGLVAGIYMSVEDKRNLLHRFRMEMDTHMNDESRNRLIALILKEINPRSTFLIQSAISVWKELQDPSSKIKSAKALATEAVKTDTEDIVSEALLAERKDLVPSLQFGEYDAYEDMIRKDLQDIWLMLGKGYLEKGDIPAAVNSFTKIGLVRGSLIQKLPTRITRETKIDVDKLMKELDKVELSLGENKQKQKNEWKDAILSGLIIEYADRELEEECEKMMLKISVQDENWRRAFGQIASVYIARNKKEKLEQLLKKVPKQTKKEADFLVRSIKKDYHNELYFKPEENVLHDEWMNYSPEEYMHMTSDAPAMRYENKLNDFVFALRTGDRATALSIMEEINNETIEKINNASVHKAQQCEKKRQQVLTAAVAILAQEMGK